MTDGTVGRPEHHTARVNGITVHYVVAGEGPPVFLLHGFPEFWYAWRHQIPALARRYTVVAPDLRGYGYSEKPYHGYDKRTMATDVRELAALLGFGRFALVGHDRGARVALRLVKDAPETVSRLAVLDNVPTRVIFETMNAGLARGQWWFLFNQVPNLPEALIAGREEIWLRHFFTSWCHDPQALTPDDLAEYVRAYAQPGAVMGACNDYRAGQQDQDQDDQDADVKVTCPVLALWGADFQWVGQAFDVAAVWAQVAGDLRTVELPDCAHLPHEERPAEVKTPRRGQRASAQLPGRVDRLIRQLPELDFVVLSHHHGDHFDRIAARDLDHGLPVITEPHAARKLRRQGFRSPIALSTWQSQVITRGGAEVRVTSLPGKHAPRPLGYLVPPVMGSLLDFSRDGTRLLRMYITGDTLMHDGINAIAQRFGDIDLCLIHLGGTKIAGVLLTMDGQQGIEALRAVAPRFPFTTTTTRCSSRRCPNSGRRPRMPGLTPACITWTGASVTGSASACPEAEPHHSTFDTGARKYKQQADRQEVTRWGSWSRSRR